MNIDFRFIFVVLVLFRCEWNDVDDLIIYLSWKSFVISIDTGTPRSSWNAWSAGTSSKLFLLYAGLQNSSYTCLQNRLVYDECLTYLHGSYVIKWWVRELALNLSKKRGLISWIFLHFTEVHFYSMWIACLCISQGPPGIPGNRGRIGVRGSKVRSYEEEKGWWKDDSEKLMSIIFFRRAKLVW